MSRLVLMCGLSGSGKSTYARRLVGQGWLRFSLDQAAWDAGHRDPTGPADEVADAIRRRQRREIGDALDAGHDVVADYAFAPRADRDDYRALGHAHGAEAEVVHLAVDVEVLRRRLAARRGAHVDDVVVDPARFDAYLATFEPPAADEPDVTVVTGTSAEDHPG